MAAMVRRFASLAFLAFRCDGAAVTPSVSTLRVAAEHPAGLGVGDGEVGQGLGEPPQQDDHRRTGREIDGRCRGFPRVGDRLQGPETFRLQRGAPSGAAVVEHIAVADLVELAADPRLDRRSAVDPEQHEGVVVLAQEVVHHHARPRNHEAAPLPVGVADARRHAAVVDDADVGGAPARRHPQRGGSDGLAKRVEPARRIELQSLLIDDLERLLAKRCHVAAYAQLQVAITPQLSRVVLMPCVFRVQISPESQKARLAMWCALTRKTQGELQDWSAS